MAPQYMLGNEVIAHACLEANLDFASGYPGTPSSEVIDVLRYQKERDFHIEWSVNEKVAFENALAAAWCGLRSLVTMKHVGLNVAADPLMTSAYTGVTGGFVILSADDPFAHSSQNEQDSRCYAHFAKIPCLDPSSLQEAHEMVLGAFPLSEEFGLPVLFRPTTRICHSKSDVISGEVGTEHRTAVFNNDPRQYVVIPAHTRILHKILNEKQIPLAQRLVELGYNKAERRGKVAVITSGIAAEYCMELLPADVSFAKIGGYPIDEAWLKEFIEGHEKVLVVEELAPVVEEIVRQVSGVVPVFGKKNGIVPYEGELDPSSVAVIMKKAGIIPTKEYQEAKAPADVPRRPPLLCAGCGHRATFHAIKKVFKNGIFPSDIGCYTLGLQLGAVDTTICMGASVTVGSGISNAGEERDIVATIGDSTFMHTGINGLLNAVYNGAKMTLVILDNRITAMTGHQPNPNTGVTAQGVETPQVSLEALCRACGVTFVETVHAYDYTGLVEALKKAKATGGVKVILARQACVISEKRAKIKRKPFTVDASQCTGCGVCLKFGCPAIETDDEGKASITSLCSGCSVCAQLCPSGAIHVEGRS